MKSVPAHVLHEKTNSFSFTTSTDADARPCFGVNPKQLLIPSLGIHRSNPDADAGATVQEQLWIPPDDAMPPILTSLLLLSNKSTRKGRPFFSLKSGSVPGGLAYRLHFLAQPTGGSEEEKSRPAGHILSSSLRCSLQRSSHSALKEGGFHSSFSPSTRRTSPAPSSSFSHFSLSTPCHSCRLDLPALEGQILRP